MKLFKLVSTTVPHKGLTSEKNSGLFGAGMIHNGRDKTGFPGTKMESA